MKMKFKFIFEVHSSTMTSIKEQFLSHDDSLKAFAIATILEMDTMGPGNIIMTRSQFDHLAPTMRKRGDTVPGCWSMFFYPKSGHMVEDPWDQTVYPLVALPHNYAYYKWLYGPGFPEEWANFANKIQNTISDYVVHDNDSNMFKTVDNESGEIITGKGFVGGGKIYCEKVATSYQAHKSGIIIK